MCVCVCAEGSSSGKLQVGLDLNLRDGLEETALGLALWTEQFDVAQRLLQMGAELEAAGGRRGEEMGERERGGANGEPGLLYIAIVREKPRACLFLLDHGADFKTRSALPFAQYSIYNYTICTQFHIVRGYTYIPWCVCVCVCVHFHQRTLLKGQKCNVVCRHCNVYCIQTPQNG